MSLARTIITNHERKLRLLFRFIRGVESFLGPEDDWIEDDRRRLFEWLQQRYGDKYTFVYHIGTQDYVTSVDLSPDEVDVLLHNNSYERNLVSGRKYRTHHDGGKQWAHASWARYYPDKQQHHVFIFESSDGGTDIYAHYEDDVIDPAAHLHIRDDDDDVVGMRHADPGPLYDIFEDEGIESYDRKV